MANVNTTVTQLLPQAGAGTDGLRIGYLNSATKAAQNDTVTITNASEIVDVIGFCTDAAGAAETRTFATNVITATSITTGTVSGIVLYR